MTPLHVAVIVACAVIAIMLASHGLWLGAVVMLGVLVLVASVPRD